jgi:hypothetical protein
MDALTAYHRLLQERGVSLEPLGIREIALRRSDALNALDFLRAGAAPLLGGDVFWLIRGRLELAYANWQTDREASRSTREHSEMACAQAATYIARFPEKAGAEPLFSLIVARLT